MPKTQLTPYVLPGRRYGSFAGKPTAVAAVLVNFIARSRDFAFTAGSRTFSFLARIVDFAFTARVG